MENFDFRDWLRTIEKSWSKKSGLVISLIFIVFFVNLIKLSFEFDNKSAITLAFILAIITSIKWYVDNYRIPKTKKNKIGFIVSIRGGNEQTKESIKQDFIDTLKDLLQRGKTGGLFQFIELPEAISSSVTDRESANRVRIKSRAHYIIYGRVRDKIVNGKEIYYFELDGEVAHRPIPIVRSEKLAVEFRELLPKAIQIPKENDLYSFEFTSEWMVYVSRYIIAIAAACSGDLEHALKLFNELDDVLKTRLTEFKPIAKIKDRVPNHIREIYLAYSTYHYEKWRKDRTEADLTKVKEHLDAIPSSARNNVSYYTQMAIYEFVSNRNITTARDYLHKIKNKDAVWYFNAGFLDAYEGRLNSAFRKYKKAIRLNLHAEIVNEIEEFMFWVAENDDNKEQLYYCLGYYNWKVKGDLEQAINDFLKFLDNANRESSNIEYRRAIELAEIWVRQVEAERNAT